VRNVYEDTEWKRVMSHSVAAQAGTSTLHPWGSQGWVGLWSSHLEPGLDCGTMIFRSCASVQRSDSVKRNQFRDS